MNEWFGFFRGIGKTYFKVAFGFLLLTVAAVIIWQVTDPERGVWGVLVAALFSLTLVAMEIAITQFHLYLEVIGLKADREKLTERQTIAFRYELLKMQDATVHTFQYELLKVQDVMVKNQNMHFEFLRNAINAIQGKDTPDVQAPS